MLALELPERHDQKIHGENSNQDHLPESQVTGAVVIAGHVWIAIEEALADAEDVKAAAENDREKKAKNDSKNQDRIAVLVNDS